METSVDELGADNWQEVLPHREGVRIEDVDAFESFMVITERRDGIPVLRVFDHAQDNEFEIQMAEPVFEAAPGTNAEYSSRLFRYVYTSMVTPASTYEIDIDTREQVLLKQQPG